LNLSLHTLIEALMPNPKNYFEPEVITGIREAIAESGENEVFFVASGSNNGMLQDVRVLARGNVGAVPAILPMVRPGDMVIHNHPSGYLQPSDADIHIASYLGNQGVGSCIVDNDVEDIYVVVERMEPKSKKLLNSDDLADLLGEDGPLSTALQQYEYRQPQIDMLHTVAEALNSSRIAAIEAGTGTGKTVAYLLPAIQWALENNERVVISTHTITLQEQIIGKDIPLLQQIFPNEFKAVLVKGRGNYLCLRKAALEEREAPGLVLTDEQKEMHSLLRWANETETGDRSELTFEPRGETWEKLRCEVDTCTRVRCKHFQDCHLVRARREAATAHVLVANHHLLFADLALRLEAGNFTDVSVLPPYQRIIIDEAHHVEDVATAYFGNQLTRTGFRRMISRITSGGRDSRGTLSKITEVLQSHAHGPAAQDLKPIISHIDDDLQPLRDTLIDRVFQTFDAIADYAESAKRNNGNAGKVRLKSGHLQSEEWHSDVIGGVDALQADFQRFIRQLKDLRANTEDYSPQLDEELEDHRIELSALANRLEGACSILKDFVTPAEEPDVRWVESREYRGNPLVSIHQAPLSVAEKLADALYGHFPTVVFTSATLTVDHAFDYFARRVGVATLPEGRCETRCLPSPFDYPNQVLVAAPTDLPAPTQSGYVREAAEVIRKSVQLSKGRAFILFTSFRTLGEVWDILHDGLEQSGYTPLRQGSEPRTRLLQRFRNDVGSVLFAAASFWEGVDVEGEALESIIITRLPFRVPTEPIIEARIEAIEKAGGDAFMEYSVPDAVLRFKQGFGRLIRRKTDRGTVLVLDNRMTSKSYGRIFLRSLPDCRVVKQSTETVLEELEKFG
jgi:ATP-dependent DNA helicase DinG